MNTYKITVLAKLTIEVTANDDDSAIKQLDTTELSEFKLVDFDVIEFENEGKSDNINPIFAEVLSSWRP
jgi:hypothetical protein